MRRPIDGTATTDGTRTPSVPSALIRDATDDDMAGIGRLHIASWRSAYAGLLPRPFLDRLTYEEREGRWRRWLEDDDGRRLLLVAVDGDALVGFVAGWPEPDGEPRIIEVAALHVARSLHGRGLGKCLLARVASRGERMGYAALSLEMLEGNPTGGFYDHLGGRVTDRYTSILDGEAVADLRYRWDDIATLSRLDRRDEDQVAGATGSSDSATGTGAR